MSRMMLKRTPDFGRWKRKRGQPILQDPVLAQDSSVWLASAQREQLLIEATKRPQLA